jgi:hypothetical protein
MSATNVPFGFVPARNDGDTPRAFPIAAAYATPIYKNQPVTLLTDGTITASAVATDILGIFCGVEYIDFNGRPQVSNFWPGAQAGATDIRAYVLDDFEQEYLVQANGPVAAAAIGDQADLVNPTANGLGLSQSGLNATLVGVGIQGQFRIVGIERAVDNAAGDAFTRVLVRISRHQYMANKVAI